MIERLFVFMSLLAMGSVLQAGAPALVPQPAKMEVGEGSFLIAENTRIAAGGAALPEAGKLAEILGTAMGIQAQDREFEFQNSRLGRNRANDMIF